MRGDNELKRAIKRTLVSVRSCACKLTIIQKILVTLALLRQSSLNLKLKLSVILQSLHQFETRTVTVLSRALHAVNVHTTKHRRQTIITLVISAVSILNLFFFATISGQLFTRTSMYSYGTIQIQTAGVVAYRDFACTTGVSEVAWGSLAPGSSSTNTFYLKNEGTTSLTLSLDTTSWNPTSAPNYMTLSWDYNGQTIAPDQVIQVTLTLSVSQGINGINYFGFEIMINATS